MSGTKIALAARAFAPLTKHDEELGNYEGGPCPPYMSGHDVLGFPRTPIFIKKSLVAQAFQPVPAQDKACGYLLSIYPLNTEYKIPAGHF